MSCPHTLPFAICLSPANRCSPARFPAHPPGRSWPQQRRTLAPAVTPCGSWQPPAPTGPEPPGGARNREGDEGWLEGRFECREAAHTQDEGSSKVSLKLGRCEWRTAVLTVRTGIGLLVLRNGQWLLAAGRCGSLMQPHRTLSRMFHAARKPSRLQERAFFPYSPCFVSAATLCFLLPLAPARCPGCSTLQGRWDWPPALPGSPWSPPRSAGGTPRPHRGSTRDQPRTWGERAVKGRAGQGRAGQGRLMAVA